MASPLTPFVQDLSLTLATAGAVCLVAQRLKLPLIIAYILAGLAVGPQIGLLPTVLDPHHIQVMADIGLIFLIFGIGLEFSFRKLISLGPAPILIGILETSGMIVLGTILGLVLGLPQSASLTLGALVAISSTGVIVKLVQEKRLQSFVFAQTAIAVLIVEDLFAIVILLLLPILAGANEVSITTELSKVLGVSVLWIFLGTILVPSVIEKSKKLLSDEVLLIGSIGLCLGVTYLCSFVGISSALVAFLTGSILAESSVHQRIEHITKPVRDLFAALFFVAMGMLIVPKLVLENYKLVIVVTLLIIVGKSLLVVLSGIIAGKHYTDAIKSGLLLCQIGEFSIILASMAVTKGILDPRWNAIIISSAILSILCTPIMVYWGPAISKKIEKKLPKTVNQSLSQYYYSLAHLQESNLTVRDKLRAFVNFALNALLVFAIFTVVHLFQGKSSGWLADFGFLFLASILSSPFLGMMVRAGSVKESDPSQRYSFLPNVFFGILTVLIYSTLSYQLIPDWRSLIPVGVLIGILLISFRSKLQDVNLWLFKQLSPKHVLEEISAEVSLGPWDEHLSTVVVNANSEAVEKNLAELDVRNRFGINIIMLKRGNRQIVAPSGDTRLLPGDSVLILGTDNEVALFDQFVSGSESISTSEDPIFELTSVKVEKGSKWENKSISSLNLPSLIRAVIVGVERGGERVLSPQADFILKAKDFVWLVLDKSKLGELKKLV